MSRPRRSGINTIIRTRADGTKQADYYDRRTGRFLGHDRQAAIIAAMEPEGGPAPASFDALCTAYLKSTRFRALARKTQGLNRFYVDILREKFGAIAAVAITRPVVVRLREANSARPWYCVHLLAKLRLVLQHGVDIGVLTNNPALKPGGANPEPRRAVWTDEQVAGMLAASGPDIRLACALLFYTAQRPSDVLAMTWSQVAEHDGRFWITLRQQKTGSLMEIPVHRELEQVLAGTTRRTMLMVPSPTGLSWSYRNFSRAWDAAAREAGIWGVQRRDLRRTAMVRMAEAGATTAQIAGVSGHTIQQTTRILDTYIPRRGEVAAGAIGAWESRNHQVNVLPLRVLQQILPHGSRNGTNSKISH